MQRKRVIDLPKQGHVNFTITRNEYGIHYAMDMNLCTLSDLYKIAVYLIETIAEAEEKPITAIAGKLLAKLFEEATPTSL